MDENPQDQPAQNEPVAPASDPAASPPAESQEPAAPAETPSEEQPERAQTEQPEEAPRPSRAEKRIKQLTEQVKQATPQNQQYGQQQQSPQFPKYEPGAEIPAEQLERDVVQTASAIAELQVQRQLAQRDAVHNFERDTDSIPTKYAELNPDSPSYTPELDEAIAQEYQAQAFRVIGYNQQGQPVTQLDPSVRLSDIAERHMRAARAYAAKASAEVRTVVDATADQAAPRPGGDKPADRKFEDLTLEEMKAKVGYFKG